MGNSLLVFSASWCGPCKMYKAGSLKDVQEKGYAVTMVDIEDPVNEELVVEYACRGIPMTVVMKNGVKGQVFHGPIAVTKLVEALEG